MVSCELGNERLKVEGRYMVVIDFLKGSKVIESMKKHGFAGCGILKISRVLRMNHQ